MIFNMFYKGISQWEGHFVVFTCIETGNAFPRILNVPKYYVMNSNKMCVI